MPYDAYEKHGKSSCYNPKYKCRSKIVRILFHPADYGSNRLMCVYEETGGYVLQSGSSIGSNTDDPKSGTRRFAWYDIHRH